MDDRFDRIDSKLDKIDNRLNSMDITLAKQEVNLKEHMKRTVINEKAIDFIHKLHLKIAIMLISGLLAAMFALWKTH